MSGTENSKRIINALNKEIQEMRQKIKTTGDPVGYFQDRIDKLTQRKEIYIKRIKLRKND